MPERGCLRHDDLINCTFSVSQFEPESEKTKRTFSVCASWSFPLFRSESDSESPEGARHGTATDPARVERKRVVGRDRREGGVEKGVWGGGNLDRIRSPVCAVATTSALFAREHIRFRLLSGIPERTGRLDQLHRQQTEVETRRRGCSSLAAAAV